MDIIIKSEALSKVDYIRDYVNQFIPQECLDENECYEGTCTDVMENMCDLLDCIDSITTTLTNTDDTGGNIINTTNNSKHNLVGPKLKCKHCKGTGFPQ